MRKLGLWVVVLCAATPAHGEMQNVEVGGEIQVRGRYYRNWNQPRTPLFVTGATVPGRAFGPFALTSMIDLDSKGNDLSFVEQRTVINVKADFTDDVSAFIEIESFDIWGEDFRSAYLTGADARATHGIVAAPTGPDSDLEIYQAYIDVNEMYGSAVRLRMGRQELKMGKAWLVGHRIFPTRGLSHDGIRVTYSTDVVEVDAWWTKLLETSPAEEDGDIDFYGVYATYKGLDAIKISGYWLFIRDSAPIVPDTTLGLVGEWVEQQLGLDDYGSTTLHTFGIRAFGGLSGFDYDLEVAYQTGEMDALGALYKRGVGPRTLGIYGDTEADVDHWAADLEVGYSFDISWRPRVFVGGAYFDSEDNSELTFREWLNPFTRPEVSSSFNRIFSSTPYSTAIDLVGGSNAISNFNQIRGGVVAHPTDSITTGLKLAYFWATETANLPVHFRVGTVRIPYSISLSFLTEESDDDLGATAHLWLKYNYSEDLWITFGWEGFFPGEGAEDGNFILKNGQDLLSGTDDEEVDYFYFHTGIKF